MSAGQTMRGAMVAAAMVAAGTFASASAFVSQTADAPTYSQRPQHRVFSQRNMPSQAPAPVERRPPQASSPQAGPSHGKPALSKKGEHLNDWMSAHSNLSPQQQQDALRNEPGFRELPQATQQRYMERLNQLNAMAPDARRRTLEHNEQMERLSPDQRAQVRRATSQWGALPPDEKHTVGKAFRELRGMPPEQRLEMLNGRYRDLSPAGRQALQQLMQVEPLLPPDHL